MPHDEARIARDREHEERERPPAPAGTTLARMTPVELASTIGNRAFSEQVLARNGDTATAPPTTTTATTGTGAPTIDIEANDAAHVGDHAHTKERHGADIPLDRDTSQKTIEGRIWGDAPWTSGGMGGQQNRSAKWKSWDLCNTTLTKHVAANWAAITAAMQATGAYKAQFDAGSGIGEGFYNARAGQPGGKQNPQPMKVADITTVDLTMLKGADGSPFVLTAFPLVPTTGGTPVTPVATGGGAAATPGATGTTAATGTTPP